MKNLLVKLSLIAVLVVACNTASATFSDSTNTYALWHCDATNRAGTEETTPDENLTACIKDDNGSPTLL